MAEKRAQSEIGEARKEIPDVEIQKVMEDVKSEQPQAPQGDKVQLDSSVVDAREKETHRFDAKMDDLLGLLINSVYSSRDYFLRELISNANDANDKWRLKCDAEGRQIDEELSIRIVPNKAAGTLTIIDKGVGMTKGDLVNYLGSIANSGTKEFRQAQALESKGKGDMSALIGQFGLGFYAAFLVADQVDVISRTEEDGQHIWSSRGPGGFVVAPHHGESIGQGTHVILHIDEKYKEYLEERKIEDVVKTHSMFIEYPIYLQVEVERDAPEEPAGEPKEGAEDEAEKIEEVKDEPSDEIEELKDAEEPKGEKPRKKVKVIEDKHLNSQKPLWARNPKDKANPITHEEYAAFYKALTNDWEDHFAVNHSHIEGDVELQLLLFIPKRPPFNMFEKNAKRDNIKLYVQNVLVSSTMEDGVSEWMSFVKGVVGSKDLPINVSRETLQAKDKVMRLIKRMLTKKVLEMIKDLAAREDEYKKFYENFASSLKFAIHTEKGDLSQKMAKFLRYETSKSSKPISFDEYVARMKPEQKQIYVITGMKREDVVASPFLEAFSEYEVIYMWEPMDEFVLQNLPKYEGVEFQRITSEGVEIPGEKKLEEDVVKSFEDFLKGVKGVLGDDVDKVVLSNHLKKNACAVTSGKYAYSAMMEQIMRAQPGGDVNPMLTGGFMTRKNFELNLESPVVLDLKRKYEEDKEGVAFKDGVRVIFETSLLDCGYSVKNLSAYTSKVFKYLEDGLARAKGPCEGEPACGA